MNFIWEYQKVVIYSEYELDNLNQYGQKGWELIQIVPTPLSTMGIAIAIFKRMMPGDGNVVEDAGFLFRQAT